MRDRLRSWLPWLKAALTVAIVGGVAWFFMRVLRSEELQETDRSRSPGQTLWDEARAARAAALLAAGGLSLAGLAFSGVFWLFLLRRVGQPLPPLVGARTYFVSHLGKYAVL